MSDINVIVCKDRTFITVPNWTTFIKVIRVNNAINVYIYDPSTEEGKAFLLFYDICTRFNYINQHL